MPVPNRMADLFSIASSNSPAGTEAIGNSLDNYLRAAFAILRSTNAIASSTIAAASTTDITNADGEAVQITGSATINSFGVGSPGLRRELRFSGVCTLVHSANIQLDGINLVTAAGDAITFRCTASGVWSIAGLSYGLRRTGDRMYGTLQVGAAGNPFASISYGGGNQVWVTGNSIDGSTPSADLVYRGATHTWTNSSGTNIAAMSAGGEMRTLGGSAGFLATDRTSGRQWLLYGTSDIFRLNASGLGDRFTVDSAGNFVATGNVTGNSDERLKKNWRPLPADFVERLARVKHGVYDRTDIEATQAGVGAQSLRDNVLGELVHEAEDGRLSVAYGNAGLLGAIAACERLLALESRVKKLEGG